MLKYILTPCAALLMLLPFAACKKREKVPAGTAIQPDTTPSTVLRPVSLPSGLASRLQPGYRKCQGKLRAVYQDEKQTLPFTLSFKTERGVRTSFTVTAMLGIPVATGWIRPDSVYVDNRLGGQKIKEPLTRLTDITGLPPDLAVVEGILSGQYSLPRGFAPIAASDSSLTAYPLPDDTYKLTAVFSKLVTWPSEMLLSDGMNQYAIRNYAEGFTPGPGRTFLVQTDSAGKVLSSVKLETSSRKFED